MTCANHPDREKVAFCQNCGKPLCQECTRSIGSAVFCEPCLAARLGVAMPPAGAGSYGYTDPVSGATFSGTQPTGSQPGSYAYVDPASGIHASGVVPPVPPSGAPNPVLAFFLGLIPGVGAMYNEQYAKGVIHLVIFAILVSLADNHDIFGLFVFGWVVYMGIEAHHTARARRDGMPLPNPFGLNDIGEKLGFDKTWKAGFHSPSSSSGSATGPLPPDPYAAAGPYTAAGASYSAGYVPPVQAWGAPPPPPNYYGAPVPPMAPVPPVSLDDHIPHPGNRFPAGAIWLIGLGALFLIGNSGLFHGFSARFFVPAFLIGLAVWLFVRKMTCYGAGLADDGTAGYRLRLFRALRGSSWIALVGILFLLDEVGVLTWGHSWPLFIILGGVMAFLQSSAYSSAASHPYPPPYPYGTSPVPPVPPVESATTSTITSTDTPHDSEGR